MELLQPLAAVLCPTVVVVDSAVETNGIDTCGANAISSRRRPPAVKPLKVGGRFVKKTETFEGSASKRRCGDQGGLV